MNAQDTARALHRASQDADSRLVRTQALDLLDYVPSNVAAIDRLADPGSLTILLAPAHSTLIEEVRAAVASKDGADVELGARLRKDLDSRRRVDLTEAVTMMTRAPVIADVRYAGLTLASHISIPSGHDFALGMAPYNGGPLATGSFTLTERYRAISKDALQGVVIRCAPPLSDAERAALEQLSPAQGENNLGPVPMLWCNNFTWAAVGIGAVAVSAVAMSAIGIAAAGTFAGEAVVAATGMTVVYGARFDKPDALSEAIFESQNGLTRPELESESSQRTRRVAEDVIARLGPLGTARALLKVRRDLLSRGN